MSLRAFLPLVSVLSSIGLSVCYLASLVSKDWDVESWHWGWRIAFPVGVLLVAWIGIAMAQESDNTAVSLGGFALVAVPFGLLMGPYIASYTDASVVRVFVITILMTLCLGVIGLIAPNLSGLWMFAFGATIALLLGWFSVAILSLFGVSVEGAVTWIEWAGVALFSFWIVLDMNRAKFVPRTLNSAIDCAVALTIDIFGLFTYLLGATGDSN